MNGVTFTGSDAAVHAYDMRVVAVSLLTPSGGPRLGGTQLTVHGAASATFRAACRAMRQQALKCKFGANDMVSATRTGGSGRHSGAVHGAPSTRPSPPSGIRTSRRTRRAH